MTPGQSRSVRDHFERISGRWGEGYDPCSPYMSHLDLRERRAHIQRLLMPLLTAKAPPLRLLDLGCGTGDVLEGVPRAGLQVVGADLSPSMLAAAARSKIEDRFVAADAGRAPFRPGTFDVVVSAGVLEYVTDAAVVLRGIHGLLRPGGALIVSIPNRASLFRTLSRMEEACERPLSRLWRRIRGLPPAERHLPAGYRHSLWTPWAGRRLLLACGFVVQHTLYNTYGMRGWLGNFGPSLRLAAWMTRRLADKEAVSAWLAHTVVFQTRRLD